MAWQFDNAVFAFGRWVQSKLDERDDKGKRKPANRIEKLLGIEQPVAEMSVESAVAMLQAAFGQTMTTANPEVPTP